MEPVEEYPHERSVSPLITNIETVDQYPHHNSVSPLPTNIEPVKLQPQITSDPTLPKNIESIEHEQNLRYNSLLPSLTFDIKLKLSKYGVKTCQRDLINFYGTHLWNITRGFPKKLDYKKYAAAIVDVYPELACSDSSAKFVSIS